MHGEGGTFFFSVREFRVAVRNVSAPLCALGEKSKAVDDEAQLHEAAVDLRGFLELVARRFGSLGALTSREVDQVAHLHRERERNSI